MMRQACEAAELSFRRIRSSILFAPAALGKLFNDLDLGCNGCMIRTGQPQRFISAHALVADENILHGFVKGMAHVELAGDVGRWNNYAVRGLIGVWLRVEITLYLLHLQVSIVIYPVYTSIILISIA